MTLPRAVALLAVPVLLLGAFTPTTAAPLFTYEIELTATMEQICELGPAATAECFDRGAGARGTGSSLCMRPLWAR